MPPTDPLVGAHDPHLVGRGDTGEDRDTREDLVECGVTQGVELDPGKDPIAVQNGEFIGDRPGRARVVTGDHHHFNAGFPDIGDRSRRGRANRVGEPEEAEEHHIGDPFVGDLSLSRRSSLGDGEDA